MSSLVLYPNTLHSDYLGQWRSYPRFIVNGNYLDLVSKQSAAPAEMRGDPPNSPLEHKCSFIKDGKPCRWSFNRRYDRDRHERSHLKGAARVEHLHYCPLGTGCPMKFKTSSWPTFARTSRLSTHGIYTTSRDIKHLICQVCRPFVLTADPVAFAQHQAEKHGCPQSTPLPRIVSIPTTPASSSPALSRSTTPVRIALVPLTTLLRALPTPTTPRPPPCSFIVHTKPPRSESPDLEALLPPCRGDWYVVPKPYRKSHSSIIPMLRDFLRDKCGIELTQCRPPTSCHLPSPPTSSSESKLMRSGSPSSSLSASGFSPPISQATTSATTLQWPGSVSTPNPMSDTEYSRFRFAGRNVVSTRLDSQVLPTP
ncbi:hypothetical protein ARMSODRAFT_976284 [Armillaria solidipes]|uniref:Uncharacterized protein n=1 Tax=Armillaria solidipes TaxID=1076256 RepID=A0A2H3BEA8_9AGAR|nr:hypothetical protein ARMSODRAFT_976284 [Armillaria solidipes]